MAVLLDYWNLWTVWAQYTSNFIHILYVQNQFKEKRVLILHTNEFIEWINKYRNSSSDIQEEIERFYQDYPVYSRDATPYLDLNNLQDRIHKEFSSLNFNHNVSFLQSINWKRDKEKTLFCRLRNLADLNTFIGKLTVSISGAGVKKENELDCFIVAGRPSGFMSMPIKPLKTGKLQITFTATGDFEVDGITVLSDHTSKINGTVVQKHTLTIS